MSKYIDLELALNELLRLYEEDCDRYGVEIPECFDYGRAREVLIDLPTIEIVHCEDCRLCDKGLVVEQRKDGYAVIVNECRITTIPTRVNLDHYCGHGEREEE